MKLRPIQHLSVYPLFVLVCMLAPFAAAQEPSTPRLSNQAAEETPPPTLDKPRATRVFKLRNADAKRIANVVRDIYSEDSQSLTLAVEPASNSLIVSATDPSMEAVAALLEELDSPELHRDAALQNADRKLQVYHMKYAQAQEAASVVSRVIGGADEGLRIAVDERTNALLLQASDAQQVVIRGILQTLDTPQARGDVVPSHHAVPKRRILFYWLASGEEFETGKAVPRQLQPVVAELQGLGIENLQLVSRSVAALDGPKVSINSAIWAASRKFHLTLDGNFVPDDDTPHLDLTIRLHHGDDESHLQTTITAPYDHFVVLGTTGLVELENAFVIQIQSVEPAQQQQQQQQNAQP